MDKGIEQNEIRILAISGSQRKESYNAAALRARQDLLPDNVSLPFFSIANLPLFNPDREAEAIDSVEKFSKAVGNCDGLIIASPEYAHGGTGVFKSVRRIIEWQSLIAVFVFYFSRKIYVY